MSMAVPASILARLAEPPTSASPVTSVADRASAAPEGRTAWAPLPKAPMTCEAGSSPAGSGADSAASSSL